MMMRDELSRLKVS